MACAGDGVGCVAGQAGASAVEGGAVVVADERPDVGSNRAAAASACDSVLVLKHICLFYEETPSHGPIPPIVRMARWPKTPGE